MTAPGMTRVRKELAGLMKNLPPIVREVTLNNNNERDWIVLLAPDREPFKGGSFKIRILFGDRYPFQAPIVTFETKVYHPNVEIKDGKICFSTINPENWRAGVSMRDVINGLNAVLAEPEVERPSNADALQKFQNDKNEYMRLAKLSIGENVKPAQQQIQPGQPTQATATADPGATSPPKVS